MNNSGKTLFAFLAGAAAGAVAALLLAPESGRSTRDKLARQADQLMNDLEDQWEAGYEKIRDLTNSALAEVDRMKTKGEEEYEERT